MMNALEKCRQNTENFRRSYLIQKAMSEVSGYDESHELETSADIPSSQIRPFNEDLQCGQIRLLADVDCVTYIVLLHRWGDNAFVTMAFSHYDYPATDEEMSLERDAGLYLNVLQVWNTRTLLNETLKKSWLCGMLPEELCNDAWTFWLALTTGKELPDRLKERSGTPVEDEDDIRMDYLQEEMDVFARIDSADLAMTETPSTNEVAETTKVDSNPYMTWMNSLIIPSLWDNEVSSTLAAGSESVNIMKTCAIDGYKELLCMEFSPEEESVWIDIISADSQELSTTLDSSEIVDSDEQVLGIIRNGKCRLRVNRDFDGSIAIRMKNGTICILTEQV